MYSSIDNPRPVPVRMPPPEPPPPDELADSWFDHRRPRSDLPPRRPSGRPPSTVPPPSIDPVLDDWFH